LTKFGAVAAADAKFLIYLGDITRGCQHWSAIAVGLHRAAAAGTAVADGIEATQHGVFEEGVMDVPTLVFGFQDLNRLIRIDPARALRVVFDYESCKRFADDQAYI
jgi:hypothetical protein